jgi:hypothetical protein
MEFFKTVGQEPPTGVAVEFSGKPVDEATGAW